MSKTDYREMIANYVKLGYKKNLTPGVGGNMSVKVGNSIYITPALANNRDLKAEDVVIVDLDGNATSEGRQALETPMHTLVYREHPDVTAIYHIHSPFTVAMSLNAERMELATVEARYLLGPVPVVAEVRPGSDELARVVSNAIKKLPEKVTGVDLIGDDVCRVVVLKAHGIVAVGRSLKEVFDLAEILEDNAHVTYLRDTWGPR